MRTALDKRYYCDNMLPSDRFHEKIKGDNCPTSCRAEFVYYVDVRKIPKVSRSGRQVMFHV